MEETSSDAQRAVDKVVYHQTRVFVVLNPAAGMSDGASVREIIRKFCDEKGWSCEIHETKQDEDLRKLLREVITSEVDMVIACGGDGTVSAVVNGLVNSPIPLGILPAGSGNLLARDLNIPLNPEAALALLGGDHRILTIDVMQVKDAYFVMNASVGISARTMRDTPRIEKRRFGMLAYFRHAIDNLSRARRHRFMVTVDGRRMRFAASEVMAANMKFMGLQPQLEGVEIDPCDGQLDVFILRTRGLIDYLDVLLRFVLRSKPRGHPTLRYLPVTDRLTLVTRSRLTVQADGEVIGKTPVEIRLVPQALRVIVPPVP
jgi:diacylglycerol kinase (ATP)